MTPRPLRVSRSPIVRALARDSVRVLSERILQVVDRATVEECAHGLEWYVRAQATAREVGALCSYSTDPARVLATGAGILAALSPGAPWSRNVPDAFAAARGEWRHPFATYRANVRKARAIYDGADPCTVLGGDKVRAFYRCIIDPRDPEPVCIDRHALAVVYGGPLTNEARSTFVGHARLYARVSDAYRQAAEHACCIASQCQATAWIVYRRLAGVNV